MASEIEGEWIIFEGNVSLEQFLKRNRPSLIENSRHPWICVDNPLRPPEKIPDQDSLREEWEKSIRNPSRVTTDFVRYLAVKYAYTTGKWLIYSSR